MAMIAVWNKEYKSSEEFRQKYNNELREQLNQRESGDWAQKI